MVSICCIFCSYLPNECEIMASYHHKAFCGTYSQDGKVFLSASQGELNESEMICIGQQRVRVES